MQYARNAIVRKLRNFKIISFIPFFFLFVLCVFIFKSLYVRPFPQRRALFVHLGQLKLPPLISTWHDDSYKI